MSGGERLLAEGRAAAHHRVELVKGRALGLHGRLRSGDAEVARLARARTAVGARVAHRAPGSARLDLVVLSACTGAGGSRRSRYAHLAAGAQRVRAVIIDAAAPVRTRRRRLGNGCLRTFSVVGMKDEPRVLLAGLCVVDESDRDQPEHLLLVDFGVKGCTPSGQSACELQTLHFYIYICAAIQQAAGISD